MPGNPYQYSYQYSAPAPPPPFDHFSDMVPANYSGSAYAPELRDSAGAIVPYDPSVWVADGLLGVVQFKYRTPQELGYTPPFQIDYWQYIGGLVASPALANEGVGTGLVYDTTVANVALLRTLLADPAPGLGGVVVSTSGAEILLGNAVTGLNLGVGAQVFSAKTGADLGFRSVEGTPNGITVTQGVSTLTVDNTLTGANLIPAPSPITGRVFAQKSAAQLQFRTLVAGLNITLVEAADGVTISASPSGGGLSGLNNEGGGVEVFDTVMGTTAVLRTLVPDPAIGSGGIAVTQNATTISIGNTLTGANLGLGAQVFSAKSGATLNLRSLVAGANIALTQGATDITLAATGVVTALANEGGGAGVFDSVVGSTANLRSLVGTANGLSVTQGATTITVDNTLTGANLGLGAQVFSAKSGATLNLRSLVAGPNIALTQGATEITIAATGGSGSSYARTPVNVAVYAVLASDDILAVLYTPTGLVTLNLPPIAGLGGPKRYTIVDEGGAAFVHPITVAAAGGDTIIGLPSVAIENNYNSIRIYHDGASGWFIA